MPDFQFESVSDFFDMGGYAYYVWLAYFFYFAVMGWNLIQPKLERRKVLKVLLARQARDNAPVQTAQGDNHRE